MEEKTITFSFEARYFTSGELLPDTRHVLFVLHGYGQLARYFIRKFEPLTANGIRVIAPEGLSRFYLEKFEPGSGRPNDRVGATWMTKENRLMDISNYIAYLDEVFRKESPPSNIPVSILGFSQGAATACRWAVGGSVRFDQLILWSGVIPPDMDITRSSEVLKKKKVVIAYGTEDPFLKDDRFKSSREAVGNLGIAVQETVFKGGHDIEAQTLLSILTGA